MPVDGPQHLSEMPESRAGQRNRSPRAAGGPGNIVIVAIGASAGGLDACSKLLNALSARTGMAFVIVQHLDPTHASLLAELLASHTAMTVQQASDGMLILPDNVYIIPPSAYLSVRDGVLHLAPSGVRHGARLPFDFLLVSLAQACGPCAICVVLSGTGADGSAGLRAIKAAGGLVIAELPEEAEYDGMPRSAIATGDVDLVLPIEAMPAAIEARRTTNAQPSQAERGAGGREGNDSLQAIIELLRGTTSHDFTLYKRGTLERRVGRRMAMAAIALDSMAEYLSVLRRDQHELELLGKDLLINVTSFFRDPAVFDVLAKEIIPGLVRSHKPDQTLRLWVAGCSTGEETYSLAILFREEIAAARLNIKLQIFASDVDADAVAAGRDGLYPATIEKDVSPARLARFFSKEDRGYRVSPELRGAIVFTVQDVLTDPPFSRIDMISCRNLLIYLRPEAQAKVIALFHFSLRQGGYLLLGSAETLGDLNGRFEIVSKSARLYRHIARSRPGELGFSMNTADGVRVSLRAGGSPGPSRQSALAELCRRLVIENYAPAAVLINQKHECLFSLGPLDRYLRVAPGHPTHDVLAMARPGLRTKIRTVIQQAWQTDARVTVVGGRTVRDATPVSFSIDVHPVAQDDERLLLVCFIDTPQPVASLAKLSALPESGSVADLERELDATRLELRAAIRNLELSGEEQTAINEEALSVNEEYQSTNEELLTSKEELQSLNEELTALNSQLQETLERQRSTANDLQNVLYSTNVATLFLDTKLNIRFFTPATKALFSVIVTDIGRPLADLKSLAVDTALLDDARAVIANQVPAEREIETQDGVWYLRRILPYRAQDGSVEGVVITFADVTERRRVAQSLLEAKRDAETANIAKSRFLAAASHDLRQPLQALALLQGMLAKKVEGEAAQRLVALMDPTLSAMTTMLNTLLDINQIDSGAVQPQIVDFVIGPLLARLRDEFAVIASAYGLSVEMVPCSHVILTDPSLLEQMLRNILSNALKYTKVGRVLLGCRHRAGTLSIEVWDTGIGIPAEQLSAIFDEYQQVDNPARQRSRGLGLGLSIVKRLGDLLGHRVRVQSRNGSGSMFAIEVEMAPQRPASLVASRGTGGDLTGPVSAPPLLNTLRKAAVLAIEDDPDLRNLLELVLTSGGHVATMASNGPEALGLVARGRVQPDLILADYNLPLGMNGVQSANKLRERLHHNVPVIILTGDTSSATLRSIAAQDCVYLGKPVKPEDLIGLIQRMLPPVDEIRVPFQRPAAGETEGPPIVYVVDDDAGIRTAVRQVLEEAGHLVEDYSSAETFLSGFNPARGACLLIDAYLPGMHGTALLQTLKESGNALPSVMITGDGDVSMAVRAMKAGAVDLIEKPVSAQDLLESVKHALEMTRDTSQMIARRQDAADQLAALTGRQRQIMALVLAGHPSKNIAADLGISQRTVENHRASIMHKTGSRSLPALARLVITAAWNEDAEEK